MTQLIQWGCWTLGLMTSKAEWRSQCGWNHNLHLLFITSHNHACRSKYILRHLQGSLWLSDYFLFFFKWSPKKLEFPPKIPYWEWKAWNLMLDRGETCLFEKDFTQFWKFVLPSSMMGMNTPWPWLLNYFASSLALYLKLNLIAGSWR